MMCPRDEPGSDPGSQRSGEAGSGGQPAPGGQIPAGGDQPEAADGISALGADERALLSAFDRLSPQGSLRWGFDDAMRRIAQPETDVSTQPWPGLPADLWDRGRSARIGRRFAGDVVGVMAELLANDARAVAADVAAGVNAATWDALRYLAARVEALERVADPLDLEAAELSIRPPDLGGWATHVDSLLGPADGARPVLVGECGNATLVQQLHDAGWRVEGVEPRAASAWEGLNPVGGAVHHSGDDAVGNASRETSSVTLVIADVLHHLRTVPPQARAGVVLAGCVDRFALEAKVALLDEAVRCTTRGGTVVVLVTDQAVWDEMLDPPSRDLAPGRPLHPETWSLLMRRLGLLDVAWQGPGPGGLYAVSAQVRP